MAAAIAGVISPKRALAMTILSVDDGWIFSSSPVVSSGFHHSGGGDAVGSNGIGFQVRETFF